MQQELSTAGCAPVQGTSVDTYQGLLRPQTRPFQGAIRTMQHHPRCQQVLLPTSRQETPSGTKCIHDKVSKHTDHHRCSTRQHDLHAMQSLHCIQKQPQPRCIPPVPASTGSPSTTPCQPTSSLYCTPHKSSQTQTVTAARHAAVLRQPPNMHA